MALVLKDRVQETTTTSGTGTLTLLGAVSGFDTFSASIGNGNITYYTIFDNTAYVWEVGIGTVGAGTLARTTVLSNSSGTTTPISLAGNVAFVFCTYPAEKSINYDADGVATIGQTLGYADTGIVGSFASTVAGYNQVIVQNKSTATNASANLNVSNDAGTSGANYAELGINSSTFTGTGSFNIAGASYVASASTDLTLGTYGAYNVHFVTNSNTTDAMTIFNDGGISLGGFANPGIANMAASKFVPGYTAVTSAAGTTVLTEDSNYYQNLLGSTTQTYQLPDATTLLVGTTFIFDNDSSGTLTVVDNASGPIETVPGGAASFVYLAVNSTVAGTWRRHAFLPASYDFNSTTANFGTATITNATWNGNTIGTAYGGTGLTTFGSANYALYSTSSSTLVAGTLPVAAGGTNITGYAVGDLLFANTTTSLDRIPVGTNGYVLTSNGTAPAWTSLSSSAVTSFQTSLSGLTPSTATTGAVTLAGTLGPTSGGTGLTSYTTGDIIYASATNTLSTLADVATGNALISGGVSTAPSWGKIGLTTHVSGTLPVASGGTGTSTAFTTGSVVFAGASGTYTQDNANFFWDDTNNRLGIGTSSPSYKLDVSGEANVSNGTNQVLISGVSGNIEIVRSDAVPFIDFKSAIAEDYDCRIQQISNGLVFQTGGNGTASERMRITSTGAIQDGSGNPLLISGKETIWVPAFAMTPRVTNGPASILTQLGTNGTLITSLAFDTATTEYTQFQIRMPKSWNESTVTFTPVWTANSTSTASVAWVLQAKALGNAETIDAAWGTGVTVVDSNTATAYQSHIPAESSAVTIANASELEWVVFEIYRDVANVSDTLAADALLLGVTINYTTNAANDA